MYLFKLLHHWHQAPNSPLPTSRLQILTRLFCTALIPALNHCRYTAFPTDLFSLPLQLLLPSSCSSVSHGLASQAVQEKCSPGPEDGGAALPLAPSHCRAAEWSSTSSPNDVTCMRASHLNHNLWPCSQMLRGLFMCLCKRRMLSKLGEESRERPQRVSQDTEKGGKERMNFSEVLFAGMFSWETET